MSGNLLSHSNSFGFEMEKDAAGCRALNRNFIVGGGVMAYLSDDELLDTEGGFTGWDDGTGAGAEETLEQALAEERLAELENELEQDEHPIDYEAELEDEEEEAAPVSDKRLKREIGRASCRERV